MKNYTMISKKTVLFAAAVLALATNSAYAQSFISEDFNSVNSPALPAGWTSSPGAQWVTGVPNTVMPNLTNITGLSANTPAHMQVVGVDGSQASADGSMIASPAVSIPASATGVILQFDFTFFNTGIGGPPPASEGLVFRVSTDGGATWSDVDFIGGVTNPQNSTWDTRTIAMGTYAGEDNLKIGFRYTNEGGTIIGAAFDNIRLVNGTDGTVIAAFAGDHPDPVTGTGYQLSGSAATLTGSVQNTGSLPINSYSIKYQLGNGPVQTSSLISTPLAPLATADFPAGLTVAIPADGSYSVHAWIDVTNDVNPANDTAVAVTVGVPSIPVKRPVFEEGTGTWCGWCPRGAVFMDHFAATHPEGCAAQIAVHNGDPMTVSAYESYMSNYLSGFPSVLVDRTVVKDPSAIDSAYTVSHNNFGFADFTIGTPVINGNTVSVPVTIVPVVAITHPKLALAVTESNVTGSGSNWAQNNYYSGGGSGVMGGWENEAPGVDNAYFHFVARNISPSAGGADMGLPSTLAAGSTYTATLTATLDGSWKPNDLQYIALLINGDNTSILNSAFTSRPTFLPGLTAGLAEAGGTIEQVVLYPNPASGNSYLAIQLKDGGEAVLTVSDVTGKKVFSTTHQTHAGDNTLELATGQLTAGHYFVHFTTETGNVVVKLEVVH